MNPRLVDSVLLQKIARRLVRDSARADDVVQEAWVVALRRGTQDVANPPSWIAGVVRKLAYRLNRSEQRRQRHEQRVPRLEDGSAPDDALLLKEARELVAQAVATLPERYRDVVVLRYYDELNSSQIAQRLGLRASSVRTRLQRALDLVRAQLRATWSGSERGLMLVLACLVASGRAADGAPVSFKPLGAAAAALLIAVGASWLAVQPDPVRPSVAPTIAFVEPTTARAPLPRAPTRVAAVRAPERRLVAEVRLRGLAGTRAAAEVEFIAEPGGARLLRRLPAARTSAVDLTDLLAGRPDALLVRAAHPEALPAFARLLLDGGPLEIELHLERRPRPRAPQRPEDRTNAGPGFAPGPVVRAGTRAPIRIRFARRRRGRVRSSPAAAPAPVVSAPAPQRTAHLAPRRPRDVPEPTPVPVFPVDPRLLFDLPPFPQPLPEEEEVVVYMPPDARDGFFVLSDPTGFEFPLLPIGEEGDRVAFAAGALPPGLYELIEEHWNGDRLTYGMVEYEADADRTLARGR